MISEVLQGQMRVLASFMSACVRPSFYTPFDLEVTENQWMINATFVDQAQGDKRQNCRNWRDSLK
jgi:hypothetical protein